MSMDPDKDTLALQPRPNRVGQRCRPLRPAMARRRCDSHLAGRASKPAMGSHATTFDPVSHDIDFASDDSTKMSGVGGYSEDMGYGAFVTLLFESGGRPLIFCTADVRPGRHGNVANRTTLGRRCSSGHHNPGAEASCQATKAAAARGYPQRRRPHRIPWNIANRSTNNGRGRVGIGKASQD